MGVSNQIKKCLEKPDMPHAIDCISRTIEGMVELSIKAKRKVTTNEDRHFKFNNRFVCSTDFILRSMTVCATPSWVNSGSHKFLIEFTRGKERFVMAVEEIEKTNCSYEREAVYIGASTATGVGIARQWTSGDIANFLEQTIETFTLADNVSIDHSRDVFNPPGPVDMKLNRRPKLPTSTARFSIQVYQGTRSNQFKCDLTEAAKKCILF